MQSWSKMLLGIIASVLTALSVGAMSYIIVSERERGQAMQRLMDMERRMSDMEVGKTTPMSGVTLERFHAVNSRLDGMDDRLVNIERRLERLIDSFHAKEGAKRTPKSGAITKPPDPLPAWNPVQPMIDPGGTGG